MTLDTAGPLVRGKDVEGTAARFFLTGALVWNVPIGIPTLKDAQIEDDFELPEGAPEIEADEEDARFENEGPDGNEKAQSGIQVPNGAPG